MSRHSSTTIDLPMQTPEEGISEVGTALAVALNGLLRSVPGGPYGPVELAKALGIDKVLASRVLKAARHKDAVAVVFHAPGPEPLRRVIRAAARRQIDATVLDEAERAVAAFDALIRKQGGDRSGLDSIVSAWLPEARGEFELRRKQAAFKAMSQLKGAMADVSLATVMLHPSADGEHLDVVWISGLLGLQRLRPGAGVKFATRRFGGDTPRRPTSLDGVPVESLESVRLDQFCSTPPPPLEAHHVGDVVHYTLAGQAFGPRSTVDLVFAEVNLFEMPRFVARGSNRKGYVFAEVNTPVKTLHFDVLLHTNVYPGSDASLSIYDTVLDGVADVNDPARDIDRLDLNETVQPLGVGTTRFRTAAVPIYADLLRTVCEKLRWNGEEFRGYRCRIEYPIYGSQVAIAFDPPVKVD
jgi:hypothetical protein